MFEECNFNIVVEIFSVIDCIVNLSTDILPLGMGVIDAEGLFPFSVISSQNALEAT